MPYAGFSFDRLGRALRQRRLEALSASEAIFEGLRQASEVFRRHGVARATVFGSHAERRPRLGSDVDLLVDGLQEERFYALKSELEARLGIEVDLHTSRERPAFVERARRSGIVVYGPS